MRILARILSVLAALPILVLGAFGLLSSIGPKAELADQARRQLQSFNRWVIDQGIGIPRDLAVSMEELVATTVVLAILLPAGLVLLGFGLGLFGGGGVDEHAGWQRGITALGVDVRASLIR